MLNSFMALTKIIFLIILVLVFKNDGLGQTLILPSPPKIAEGQGSCSERTISIASEKWRAKKGSTVKLHSNQLFDTDYRWNYRWSVSNAKIITGQGTSEITLKVGSGKTAGYMNASGFSTIRLSVDSVNEDRCSLNAEMMLMIGRFQEHNGIANVEKLRLGQTTVNAHCNGAIGPTVDVETAASDPENDVLWFVYKVSVGKIIGNGAKVRWDLTGVAPGGYHIWAGVDDGFGMLGKTKTTKISVTHCAN